MMQDELIASAIRGSEPAYRGLYDLWCKKAYLIGKSVCGSRSLAEDAVQEALIRFWRALPRLKKPEAAEGFFMKIVANEARRIRARRKASPEEFLPDPFPGGAGDFKAEPEDRELYIELAKAISRLPEKLQTAVRLRYYGGLTDAETSQLLGISLSSLKMRLVRGRQRLKVLLENCGFDVTGG